MENVSSNSLENDFNEHNDGDLIPCYKIESNVFTSINDTYRIVLNDNIVLDIKSVEIIPLGNRQYLLVCLFYSQHSCIWKKLEETYSSWGRASAILNDVFEKVRYTHEKNKPMLNELKLASTNFKMPYASIFGFSFRFRKTDDIKRTQKTSPVSNLKTDFNKVIIQSNTFTLEGDVFRNLLNCDDDIITIKSASAKPVGNGIFLVHCKLHLPCSEKWLIFETAYDSWLKASIVLKDVFNNITETQRNGDFLFEQLELAYLQLEGPGDELSGFSTFFLETAIKITEISK